MFKELLSRTSRGKLNSLVKFLSSPAGNWSRPAAEFTDVSLIASSILFVVSSMSFESVGQSDSWRKKIYR